MTIIELYTFYFTKSKVCYIFKNNKITGKVSIATNQQNLPKTLTQQLTSKLKTDFQIKFSELANCIFNFIATSFFSIIATVRTCSRREQFLSSLIFIIQQQLSTTTSEEKYLYRFLFSNNY